MIYNIFLQQFEALSYGLTIELAQIPVIHPKQGFLSTYNCELNISANYIPFIGAVLMDMIINIFVATSFNKILYDAGENRKITSSAGNNLKRNNIFTAIMIWNILQSIVAWLMNAIIACHIIFENRIGPELKLIIYLLNSFFCILMTYIVSMDVEVVKRIEEMFRN
ncbi:hypothetical protein Glove_21g151 [Diversispora epigaea]|uniref:Uncharacterized protein n=1 Tax=Diversispora epigaea TaxID=1348612 RepID=A0A397JPC8_9GLOM|nr:hypothetical protein Glove_21g151 [Diversispora epigaea]